VKQTIRPNLDENGLEGLVKLICRGGLSRLTLQALVALVW